MASGISLFSPKSSSLSLYRIAYRPRITGTPQDPIQTALVEEVPQTLEHWVQCPALSSARRDLMAKTTLPQTSSRNVRWKRQPWPGDPSWGRGSTYTISARSQTHTAAARIPEATGKNSSSGRILSISEGIPAFLICVVDEVPRTETLVMHQLVRGRLYKSTLSDSSEYQFKLKILI